MNAVHRARNFIWIFILAPAGSMAQDFWGAGVTAQTAARAGIYIPDAGNPLDALSLNPAGLDALTRPVIHLDVLGLSAQGSFTNGANRASQMRRTAGVLPYGAFGMPVGRRLTVAAGLIPDLLSSANWKFRDAPGIAGASYGAQNEKSAILAFRTSVGLSYHVSPRVSVGASVSEIYNSNTLVTPYVFQEHPVLKGLKTLLDLHTKGSGWNSSLGIIARPSRTLTLGAAFRTRTTLKTTGTARGNFGAQFSALQIPFQRDFAYRAQVRTELPRSALVSAAWQKSPVLRLSAQAGWTNWKRSFAELPIALTGGSNTEINEFLETNSIRDAVPLHWKDQFSIRFAVERKLGETFSWAGGYSYRNNPVPSSTLSPLTAAILKNTLSTGFGRQTGRIRFDAAYQLSLPATQKVTGSLISTEFNRSAVRVWTQGLTLSAALIL